MQISALWWLFFNFLSIVVLAFYSMAEMACVSLNKIRLQYYYSKGNTRAAWLDYLLHNPSRLFGTTLIMVNLAMVIGSECARDFHRAIGLDPDWAPLSQVFLVVVFGELAPIFAARRYPEHVAMITAPVIYFSAKLLTPFLWIVSGISKLSNYLARGRESDENFYINQEELQKLLEEQDDTKSNRPEGEDFDTITANIFKMNKKEAEQIMVPIAKILMIDANATIKNARHLMAKTKERYLPIYLKDIHNVIGIAFPRDLIRIPDNKRLRDYCQPPWFITQNTNIMQILKQFKSNNQSAAVVLDGRGHTIGILSLDNIMEALFGKVQTPKAQGDAERPQLIIDRIFPGNMTVEEFNKQFDIELAKDTNLTLAELVVKTLGHKPEEGETVDIGPFELTVQEASLLEIKTINIATKRV